MTWKFIWFPNVFPLSTEENWQILTNVTLSLLNLCIDFSISVQEHVRIKRIQVFCNTHVIKILKILWLNIRSTLLNYQILCDKKKDFLSHVENYIFKNTHKLISKFPCKRRSHSMLYDFYDVKHEIPGLIKGRK